MCPVVLTRGADQQPVSTKFDMRTDPVRQMCWVVLLACFVCRTLCD
jgi:hypothetical protein